MYYSAPPTLQRTLATADDLTNARPARAKKRARASRFRLPTFRRSAQEARAATPDCAQLQSQGSLAS